jgi:hypothetical protein
MHPDVAPTYDSGAELSKLIDFYMSNPEKRIALVQKMRSIVLKNHTYEIRAKQLVGFLQNHFQVNIEKLIKVNESESKLLVAKSNNTDETIQQTNSLCIGVRFIEEQYLQLELLLKSFIAQYLKFKSQHFSFKVFIVNTENISEESEKKIKKMVHSLNVEVLLPIVFFMKENYKRKNQNPFYGYDSTDILLSYILNLYQNSISNHLMQKSTSQCDWILFTNGDNMYNAAWLKTIAQYINKPEYSIIAWDFISHHLRDGESEQLIKVEFKRKFIDLGSIIIRAKVYIKSETVFLPDAFYTTEIFARDYFAIESNLQQTNNETVLIHKCLMFHQ